MRRIKKFVLLATPMGLVACASIWGFEDATDRVASDGGTPEAPVGDDGRPIPVGDIVASDVQGIVCAPKGPLGWQGPLIVGTVTGTTLPPLHDCPDRTEKVVDRNGDPIAPPLACKCDCNASGISTCGQPTVTLYSDSNCTMACGLPQAVPDRQATDPKCAPMDLGTCTKKDTPEYAKVEPPKPVGDCTAVRTNDVKTPASWGSAVRLCGLKSDVTARCDADKAPIRESALPLEAGNYCVASSTATDCPPQYPFKRTFYDPAQPSDTRDCAACKCGPPTGGCTGTLRTADKTDCTGGDQGHQVNALCDVLGQNHANFAFERGTGPTNVSCPPSGGEPTGTFTAAPLTVCCRS